MMSLKSLKKSSVGDVVFLQCFFFFDYCQLNISVKVDCPSCVNILPDYLRSGAKGLSPLVADLL